MHDPSRPAPSAPPPFPPAPRVAPVAPDAPPLAPVVGAGEAITPELDAILTALARRARLGDRQARDALAGALAPKLAGFVAAFRRPARAAGGPRRDGRLLDLEEMEQESYLALVEAIDAYSGVGPFGPYFLVAFPWRLRDAWKRLQAPARLPTVPEGGLALREDPSAEAEAARALLAAIAVDLGEPDGSILRLKVDAGLPLPRIARELDLGRTTVARRWTVLKARLRAELGEEAPRGAPGPRPGRSEAARRSSSGVPLSAGVPPVTAAPSRPAPKPPGGHR